MSSDTPRLLAALGPDPAIRDAEKQLDELAPGGPFSLLDLGCGAGETKARFTERYPEIAWHGVDIADSNEVRERPHELTGVDTFDGVRLPYPDDSFDVVFSNQVLEHVRHPDRLLPEVRRVLRPTGAFVGEVSYLEPYHSRSIFNFTPWGFLVVLEDAGFDDVQLSPARDAVVLILRSMFRRLRRRAPDLFRTRPFLNGIEIMGRLRRTPPRERVLRQLLYSGSFSFACRASAAGRAGGEDAPQ